VILVGATEQERVPEFGRAHLRPSDHDVGVEKTRLFDYERVAVVRERIAFDDGASEDETQDPVLARRKSAGDDVRYELQLLHRGHDLCARGGTNRGE